MEIKVIDSNDKIAKYKFTGDNISIIIGRDKGCDIVLNNKNISRRHLEIKCDSGGIWLIDISPKNWVSYNDKRLSKDEETEYFDFIDLLLPANYKILLSEVSNTRMIDSSILNTVKIKSTSTNLKVNNSSIPVTDEYNIPSAHKKNRSVKLIKKKSSKKTNSITIMITLVIGLLWFVLSQKNSVDLSKKKQKIEITKNTEKIRVDPVVITSKAKIDAVRISYDKFLMKKNNISFCTDRYTREVCAYFFNGHQKVGQGIYSNGESIVISVSKSQVNLDLDFDVLKGLSLEVVYKGYILDKLLDFKMLKIIRQKNIKRALIVITDKKEDKFFYLIDDFSNINISPSTFSILNTEFKRFGNIRPYFERFGSVITGIKL